MQQNDMRDSARPYPDRAYRDSAPGGGARHAPRRPAGDRGDPDFAGGTRPAQRRPAPDSRRGSTAPVRRRRRRRRRRWPVLILPILLAALAVVLVLVLKRDKVHPATLEAGQPVTMGLFVKKPAEDSVFLSDVSVIDTTHPGRYNIQLVHKGKTYETTLTVQDTVPPQAAPEHIIIEYGVMPEAVDCVGPVQDVTQVAVLWQQPPDVSVLGEQEAVARLTDEGGNSVDVTVPLKVAYDAEPPLIDGARNIEIFLGDSIAYRENMRVTDNDDPNPTLEIDNSGVNLNAEGEYTAVYTATDVTGNKSSVTVHIKVRQRPMNLVAEDQVYAAARQYYDAIVSNNMTDMQKAFAIYHWVRDSITYVDSSDKTYWTIGAYQAFTRLEGDCFTYYSAAKAMLNMAGIENIDIVKSDTSHSRHYWLLVNLGSGWYHFDACPRAGDHYEFFMLTDAELEWYSASHENSHIFDPTLYPDRATVSVQSLVDYDSQTVRG